VSRELKTGKDRRLKLRASVCFLGVAFLFHLPVVSAEEVIIFLQDGRAIQAEKTEIIGDRIRIEKPAETIEIPRSDVLSIHPVTPPKASPGTSPPADVYRDMTPQMTDKVRREIQEPGASRGK
jgi:hypothetical protein